MTTDCESWFRFSCAASTGEDLELWYPVSKNQRNEGTSKVEFDEALQAFTKVRTEIDELKVRRISTKDLQMQALELIVKAKFDQFPSNVSKRIF